MTHLKHEKKITFLIVTAFILDALCPLSSFVLFPPDFSHKFPVYPSGSIMLMVCGGAFGMAGLTIMGIKLADEKKVLPAAGFTMLAISSGILLASIFEISQVVSYETYEKFYRIQTSGNFLYLPAMYLISTYEDFKKWIRYVGLVSSFLLLTASILFLLGNRDYKTLETISNLGFVVMFFTFFSWAYNVFINYKKGLKQAALN